MKKVFKLAFLLAFSSSTAFAADTQSIAKALAAIRDQNEIPAVATGIVMKVPKESRTATLDAMLRQVAKHYPAQLPGALM